MPVLNINKNTLISAEFMNQLKIEFSGVATRDSEFVTAPGTENKHILMFIKLQVFLSACSFKCLRIIKN